MHRSIEVHIDGDIQAIYQLVADIENWPNLLPHCRDVRILWRDGNCCVARVYASRGGIPVSWICRQECDPETPKVTFRHIGGFTRGMVESWTFTHLPDDRVTVTMTHDFRKGWPIEPLDRFVSDQLVGDFFIRNLAGETLQMIEILAEADRASSRYGRQTSDQVAGEDVRWEDAGALS